MKRLLVGLALAAGMYALPASAQQQPCQWNYSFNAGGVAQATYCGIVVATGGFSGAALPSIAAMDALPAPINNLQAVVSGPQGGSFTFVAGGACSTDGGTVFCPTDATPGHWQRQYQGPATLEMFGALTTALDNTSAIQTAANSGLNLSCPYNSTYLLAGPVLINQANQTWRVDCVLKFIATVTNPAVLDVTMFDIEANNVEFFGSGIFDGTGTTFTGSPTFGTSFLAAGITTNPNNFAVNGNLLFQNLPKAVTGSTSPVAQISTTADRFSISGASFVGGAGGGVFLKGPNSRVSNIICENLADSCSAFNGGTATGFLTGLHCSGQAANGCVALENVCGPISVGSFTMSGNQLISFVDNFASACSGIGGIDVGNGAITLTGATQAITNVTGVTQTFPFAHIHDITCNTQVASGYCVYLSSMSNLSFNNMKFYLANGSFGFNWQAGPNTNISLENLTFYNQDSSGVTDININASVTMTNLILNNDKFFSTGTSHSAGVTLGASAVMTGTMSHNQGFPTATFGTLYASFPWGNQASANPNDTLSTTDLVTWHGAATTALSTCLHVGDVIWSTVVTATTTPGWICTTVGTPGTWTPMPVL